MKVARESGRADGSGADLGEPHQFTKSPHLVGDRSISFSRRRQAPRGRLRGQPESSGQGCTARGLTGSPAVPPRWLWALRAPVVRESLSPEVVVPWAGQHPNR